MSFRGPSSAASDRNSDFLKQLEEDEDVGVAIAASLHTPQVIPHTHAQRSSLDWLLKNRLFWKTFNPQAQKVAVDEAETWGKWYFFSNRSTEILYLFAGYHLSQVSVVALSVVQSWKY